MMEKRERKKERKKERKRERKKEKRKEGKKGKEKERKKNIRKNVCPEIKPLKNFNADHSIIRIIPECRNMQKSDSEMALFLTDIFNKFGNFRIYAYRAP